MTSRAWSAGFQITPTWLDRGNDRIGIGYSSQRETDGRERVAEASYTLAAAEWLFVITNVQWLPSGPNLMKGGANRNVVVPGLRALVVF